MKRTRFENKFLRYPTDETRLAYIRQTNFCVSLFRKEITEFSEKINPGKNNLTKKSGIYICWCGGGKYSQKNFSNLVKYLKNPETFVSKNSLIAYLGRHPTLYAIFKYKDHSSIRVIKRFPEVFIFHQLIKIVFLKKSENWVLVKQ